MIVARRDRDPACDWTQPARHRERSFPDRDRVHRASLPEIKPRREPSYIAAATTLVAVRFVERTGDAVLEIALRDGAAEGVLAVFARDHRGSATRGRSART